jgi:hypothetical protein
MLLSAAAVATATVVGIATASAEGPPVATKTTTNGDVQDDFIGKKQEAGMAFSGMSLFEANGTAEGNGPERKVHCYGVSQSTSDKIMETHAFCIETDPDGDQVLWRLSTAPHSAMAAIVKNVNEAVMGTGKYAGISGTFDSTCQMSWTGYGKYLSICNRKP